MNKHFSKKILAEIEKRRLSPKPRWQFLLKRWLFWTLAIISALFGGLAIAIIIFIFLDHDPNASVYLNQSTFEDILLTIPYVWIFMLSIFIFVSWYTFRHTKRGYRHRTILIVTFSLLISIFLGLLLNTIDVGERIHYFFMKNVPYYDTVIRTLEDEWSQPQKGLLGGVIIETEEKEDYIVILDFHGNIWHIDITSVQQQGEVNLNIHSKIKIVGEIESPGVFIAHDIFSWKE
jgi:heme/copper-type cytochrome/quinol oxidase subunit 2